MGTQINIWAVLIILATHWFADFVCQMDKQAQGKSKNWDDLLSHTLIYSIILSVVSCFLLPVKIPYIGVYLPGAFFSVTFFCHTIQDYFTSRLNSKLWADKKVHWFFVSIGFDQLLHFIQLLLTYQLLK